MVDSVIIKKYENHNSSYILIFVTSSQKTTYNPTEFWNDQKFVKMGSAV